MITFLLDTQDTYVQKRKGSFLSQHVSSVVLLFPYLYHMYKQPVVIIHHYFDVYESKMVVLEVDCL